MLKMSTGSIEASPSPSPGSYNTSYTVPGGGVPKLGTLVPNRVFVGGISSSTTESELHQLFSEFGNVKQTKIIADRAGVSKGYGFVTFETEEEARRLQAASEDIVLKERKLNIAPAIKKQQTYGRSYEMGQPVINGAIYYHNGIPYTYQQNGVAMFVSDGQPCVGGGVISPTGKGSGLSTPFSLVYPGAPGTMFLPSQTQAAGVVSQQQLQFQAATALREAVQSQTPVTGGTPPGSNHAAAWRWVNPQTTTTPGPCSQSPGSNQSQSAQAGQQINQALSFTQDSGVWGPATTYPHQTQQSLTNTQPVFIPQTPVFTPTTPLYPSPTLGAQYPPVNMFTVPQQTLYPAQQQLMGQPFTQDGFSQESSSFPDSSSSQNTGDGSFYQGLNQQSQLNYQPYYPQPIVVNPDGLMYMPYMYAHQNYVQPCKDLGGGGGGSGVQELGVHDTQGTADGSVPAATNGQATTSGQATTTGQATTPGQAANEAGGNMFTQIKVPGDLKDGCQTCDNDKPNQGYLQNNQRRSEDVGSRFYYPENRFTFPTSGPLTPITPSVEPAPGSKTGYTVPQTPNTLTSKQFFHSNQSPGFHGLLTPDYTSSPHSYREKGELTLVKDPSTESSLNPPEQEKSSLFDSPFKRFTQFTGIPNMNRFPLQLVPTNRFQRRLPPSRIPYRPGTPRRGSSSQDRPLVSPRFLRQPPNRLSDNKVGFYQAGDRFGQKTKLEEGFKDDGREDGGRIKSDCSSAILEKKVLDEPDLLQGQMQRLKL